MAMQGLGIYCCDLGDELHGSWTLLPYSLMQNQVHHHSPCTLMLLVRRFLDDMLEEADFPQVDVFIVVYTEPVEIVEPTVIAAVNMNFPGAKLHVHVLDDNKNPAMAAMVNKLQCQMRCARL